MQILIHWVLYALAILLAAYLLPGIVVRGFGAALVTALVLGILNAFVKPFLLLLTLPINILTLGLFTFILNTLLIMMTSAMVPGFHVRNFWWALLFGIVLSVFNFIFLRLAYS
ncbi:phage holin family protein [candidate division FCPU426 bacterium]|nr:phage holin family protein [candidate division FCPU426 bacterium]